MTKTKTYILIASILAGLSVTACGPGSELPVERMSCTALAREIGRYSQMRDDAEINSFVASVEGVFASDSKQQTASDIESLAHDVSGASATAQLEKLNQAYERRGCR